jgi:hypothetical protein
MFSTGTGSICVGLRPATAIHLSPNAPIAAARVDYPIILFARTGAGKPRQYWEENADEWIAAVCEGEYDESRNERALSSATPLDDECEENPLAAPISGPRANRDVDVPDVITTFVWADVESNINSVKDVLSAAVSIAASAYAVAENA